MKNKPANDAAEFFQQIVEPTVTNSLENPGDRQKACLATLALAAMTKHYFYAHPALVPSSLAEFKKQLRNRDRVIGMIDDLAEGAYHLRTRDDEKPVYLLVKNITGKLPRETKFGWILGGREVVVGPKGEWFLSDLLERAIVFWQFQLNL